MSTNQVENSRTPAFSERQPWRTLKMTNKRLPFYFCNGAYLRADHATISVGDLGLIRGFGLFESLRTYGGKPFLLAEHLDRLFHAAKTVGLKPPMRRHGIARVVRRLLKKNRFAESLIRIVMTGGPSSALLPLGPPTLIVMADEFHPFPPWQYEKGISLMTTPLARIHPEIKSTVYFSAVVAAAQAGRRGFTEAVYVDRKGALLEGTTYNVFAVLPGPRLITPREGVLPGITADCVIALARKSELPVERRPLSRSMLRRAREMFITSSNREVIPVIRVDRVRIGDGIPGGVTQQLHAAYRAVAQNRLPP
ncbi:MAG: aminotransferase class IV [Verrucomicrobia bacterium]|nr:aminotransferase class IV [Verrucomicrobiota bacterium]